MSARIEAAEQSLAVKKQQADTERITIIGFDAEKFRAPFVLRCAALLVDYLLLIVSPVVSLMIASASGERGAKLFKDDSLTYGLLIAFLVLIINLIVLPLLFGRTIGKLVTGLRVVQKNGDDLSVKSALIRQLAGYALTILTGGIGFLIAVFDGKGRALHDFLAGTVVVQARRKQNKVEKR